MDNKLLRKYCVTVQYYTKSDSSPLTIHPYSETTPVEDHLWAERPVVFSENFHWVTAKLLLALASVVFLCSSSRDSWPYGKFHCQSEEVKGNRLWRPIGLWDIEALTYSRQSPHRWRWGCQHYAPATLYSQEYSWYSFMLNAESNPGP
jgi:hypothetical protein